MENASFGRWLAQRRKALGFTQEALGAQVGVARATIRKIEADERRPSKEIAEGLASALSLAAEDVPAFIRFARGESSRQVPVRSSLPQPPAPWQPQGPPINLPLSSTALIGRTREVAAVSDLLRRPAVRLVTLIGPGGIGKTRLSLQIAEELHSEFADGVWLVALGPLRDPALVLPAIAQTLGLKELGEQLLLQIVQTFLHDKQLLLVLDNFEHLIPAASVLASLLANSAGLRILATSRAPLHLMAEQEFPVPPLPLPDLDRLLPLEVLEQNDAVALFIQRTHAVKPDFRLTTVTAAAVAEICVRLDGLPLAIELAAARSKLLPPPVLLARLSHRLAVLTGGRQDMPERHQTLRNTVDWSYQLLSAFTTVQNI